MGTLYILVNHSKKQIYWLNKAHYIYYYYKNIFNKEEQDCPLDVSNFTEEHQARILKEIEDFAPEEAFCEHDYQWEDDSVIGLYLIVGSIIVNDVDIGKLWKDRFDHL